MGDTTYIGKLRDDVLGLVVVLKAMPGSPFWYALLHRLSVLHLPRHVIALGPEQQWLWKPRLSLVTEVVSGLEDYTPVSSAGCARGSLAIVAIGSIVKGWMAISHKSRSGSIAIGAACGCRNPIDLGYPRHRGCIKWDGRKIVVVQESVIVVVVVGVGRQ